jgi:hypothetical protein
MILNALLRAAAVVCEGPQILAGGFPGAGGVRLFGDSPSGEPSRGYELSERGIGRRARPRPKALEPVGLAISNVRRR